MIEDEGMAVDTAQNAVRPSNPGTITQIFSPMEKDTDDGAKAVMDTTVMVQRNRLSLFLRAFTPRNSVTEVEL